MILQSTNNPFHPQQETPATAPTMPAQATEPVYMTNRQYMRDAVEAETNADDVSNLSDLSTEQSERHACRCRCPFACIVVMLEQSVREREGSRAVKTYEERVQNAKSELAEAFAGLDTAAASVGYTFTDKADRLYWIIVCCGGDPKLRSVFTVENVETAASVFPSVFKNREVSSC